MALLVQFDIVFFLNNCDIVENKRTLFGMVLQRIA